jgi:hypothetical protein
MTGGDLVVAAVVGLAAGFHTATWGMFKDAPYEGFTWRTYLRSPAFSVVIAVAVAAVADLEVETASGMVVLFGLTYVIERAVNEFYKTFLREQDQSKYAIPMQLAVRGVVVESRAKRRVAGLVYVAGVGAVVGALYALQETTDVGLGLVLLLGSAGGWISAFGGAWKDAPHEGFQVFKFFRSPLVSLTYALLLATLSTSLVFVTLGALGYTIATLETHKTFFRPSTPRGKFAGKEIRHPEMLEQRLRFVPLYVAIWTAMIVTFVVALTGTRHGII